MDKNQLIGWVLIVGIVLGFFALNNEDQQAAIGTQNQTLVEKVDSNKVEPLLEPELPLESFVLDSNSTSIDSLKSQQANSRLTSTYGIFAGSVNKANKEYILENNKIKLTINSNGAYVSKAVLKDFRSYDDYAKDKNGELVLFEGLGNKQNIKFKHKGIVQNTVEFEFVPDTKGLNITEGEQSISFKLKADGGGFIQYTYTLKADDYLVDFDINFSGLEKMVEQYEDGLQLEWEQKPVSIEKSIKIERQGSSIFWHSKEDGYDWLGEQTTDDEETSEFATDWISFKQQFFSTILIVKGKDLTYPKMTIHYDDEDSTYLKEYTLKSPLKFNSSTSNNFEFQWFFGPNDYEILSSIDDGKLELEDEINLGWGIFRVVNEYFLYPLFRWLISSLGVSVGLGIILLTFAIKLLLFPITYKNYLSSAKMRIIKPRLEKLNDDNKDADPMKKQQATMALYKQTGVNPLAGCIPAVLQMPILIALYRLFPSSIELRHKGFLWADDLSSVDDFIKIGIEIPLYGSHVSIFTLFMAVSMFFYMKFNQQMTPSTSGGGEMQEAIQKNMKLMMNLMPLFMLFMFNNYAAGLSFYYFLANVITIAQTITIKKFIINEEVILAKIDAQMIKPMTKSRWQKKIDEIQTKQKK
jgi:YidC/Oxa1 family membrane protein insertase